MSGEKPESGLGKPDEERAAFLPQASGLRPLAPGLPSLFPLPWTFLVVGAVSLVVQFNPSWRAALLYDRTALAHGEVWRIWTGHLVHFGWAHFVADAGLFVILGWLLAERHRWFGRFALLTMPPFICAVLFWCDPGMLRYGGLSAVNLGLLLYFAAQGWQRNWTDWFWPAVLAIYLGEVVFEIIQGGRGGGMIRFDDPGIQVATSAHLASAAYALLAWLVSRRAPSAQGNPA